MPEKRIDWKNDVVPKVKERLQERINRGVPKASLRGIFYALVSLEVIPNTQNASYFQGLWSKPEKTQ